MSNLYISPQALYEQQSTPQSPTVIDVRSQEEYAAGHLPGAHHIPGDTLAQRLAELPPDRPVVTY